MHTIPLDDRLGSDVAFFLSRLGEATFSDGQRTLLVGGLVRDMLLGICSTSVDIDIAFEHDAIVGFAHLESRWEDVFGDFPPPEKVVEYPDFMTVKLFLPRGSMEGVEVVDLSTFRKESYPEAGSRPLVSNGDLEDDLKRRDFSINAMGVHLDPEQLSKLCDPLDGYRDIRERNLRILHDMSFRDDPVRLIRAVRFVERLGFRMDENTEARFMEAVSEGHLSSVSRGRLCSEIKKALSDFPVSKIVGTLRESGILRQIFANLEMGEWEMSLLESLDDEDYDLRYREICGARVPRWQCALLAITRGVSPEEISSLFVDFAISKRDRETLFDLWKRCAPVSTPGGTAHHSSRGK